MSLSDALFPIRNIPNLLRVFYSSSSGVVIDSDDIISGKAEIRHEGEATHLDLQVAKIVHYKRNHVFDVVYLENTTYDVSRFIVDNINAKHHLNFAQFNNHGKAVNMVTGPYRMTKAVPTSFMFPSERTSLSPKVFGSWLVTWSLSLGQVTITNKV